MSDLRIKEYLAQVGISRVHELDTALLEAFGQEELVDYLNQSLQMSLFAASFYDRVFFRRAMYAPAWSALWQARDFAR